MFLVDLRVDIIVIEEGIEFIKRIANKEDL